MSLPAFLYPFTFFGPKPLSLCMLALSIQLLQQQSQTREVQIFTCKTALNTSGRVWCSQTFPTITGDGVRDHLSEWDQIRYIQDCGQHQPEAILSSLKEQGIQGEVLLPGKKNHIHLQEEGGKLQAHQPHLDLLSPSGIHFQVHIAQGEQPEGICQGAIMDVSSSVNLDEVLTTQSTLLASSQ